jgi:adenosylhomocysteinase
MNVLKNSDILFLATGNLSLKEAEYKYLKNGSFLFSVTSSDDEIDISWLENKYSVESVSKYIKNMKKNGHYFFIANDGNAVNFIHGAVMALIILKKELQILG